jgi:hypothetical protein
MMQYEDNQRPMATLSLEAEGLVAPRENEVVAAGKITDRVSFLFI